MAASRFARVDPCAETIDQQRLAQKQMAAVAQLRARVSPDSAERGRDQVGGIEQAPAAVALVAARVASKPQCGQVPST